MERLYIKENYDYKFYQKELDKIIIRSKTTRDRVVQIAKFMAYKFPKLSYFWGGGHGLEKNKMIGLDKEWGSLYMVMDEGSINCIMNEYYPKSLDCSGFVSWCLVNAFYDINPFISGDDGYVLNSWEMKKIGVNVKIIDDEIMSIVKCGDIAYMEGHVGIIIDIDYFTKEIVIVHISGGGYGTNITTINVVTGLVVSDDIGEVPGGVTIDRVGKHYFTEIIHVRY